MRRALVCVVAMTALAVMGASSSFAAPQPPVTRAVVTKAVPVHGVFPTIIGPSCRSGVVARFNNGQVITGNACVDRSPNGSSGIGYDYRSYTTYTSNSGTFNSTFTNVISWNGVHAGSKTVNIQGQSTHVHVSNWTCFAINSTLFGLSTNGGLRSSAGQLSTGHSARSNDIFAWPTCN